MTAGPSGSLSLVSRSASVGVERRQLVECPGINSELQDCPASVVRADDIAVPEHEVQQRPRFSIGIEGQRDHGHPIASRVECEA